MAFELVIKHGAQVDAQEAYDFYEAEQPGLGDRFADELEKRYADLAAHPQFYSFIAEDPMGVLRDVKLAHFPFVIVYEIMGGEVVVYAVHNTARDPARRLARGGA